MQMVSFTECHGDAILRSLIRIVCGMKNLYLPVLLALSYMFAAAAAPVTDENCVDIPIAATVARHCWLVLAIAVSSLQAGPWAAIKEPLAGVTNFGAICTGSWISRNFIGTGEANFEYDNGHWGKVIFHYRDDESGTVKGFRLNQPWREHKSLVQPLYPRFS
jgi:hypothetical protein